jgi:transcriptional regulator with XRE-family HTH domain
MSRDPGLPDHGRGTLRTFRTRPERPPEDGQIMNDRLRLAMASASIEPESLARKVGVDPKTVQRWLGGRMPHPRHRWKICDILGQSEQYIWPQIILGVAGVLQTSEIVSAYAHRADAPSQLWAGMLEAARGNIDLLGYSMSFFPEQHSGLAQILDEKCARGLRMRIALADPESAEVAARDNLERLGGTLSSRIRATVVHFESLFTNAGVEIRFHDVPLYNAVYRFDDQMLVTPYLYRLRGFQHPLLHLKRLGPAGIFEAYAQQFEAIWAESRLVEAPNGAR